MSKVEVNGSKPKPAPKPTKFADITGQGRIPYGKAQVISQKHSYPRITARGMGAAKRGGKYTACI
tara:strand:+ start:4124 stop:4318 length:195 start_codon:yes stop_codon:yes gene_type:complete